MACLKDYHNDSFYRITGWSHCKCVKVVPYSFFSESGNLTSLFWAPSRAGDVTFNGGES